MVGVTTTMMIPTSEERKSIALDAASLGRVTRLNEHCVESIATESIEEDTWKLKRLQEIQNLKSTFFKAINEAAVVGLMKRSPEEEEEKKKAYDEALISDYSDDCCCSSSLRNEQDEEEEQLLQQQQQQQRPQSKRKAKRASVLTEVYISESKKEKNESWSTPEANLELTEVQESWSTMTNNNDTTTTTTLPSPIVPYFKKAFTCMTRERIVDRLAIEVAEEAHERFWRIEKRKQLTIRTHCPCKYCINPNPHQTQAYQQLWKLQKQRNGNDDSNDDLMTRTTATTTEASSISSSGQEEEHEEDIPLLQLKLPTKLVPTLSVSKLNTDQASPISLRSERHIMSNVCQQVVAQAAAQAAWERTLQLSKRGTLHRVTEKCPCTYCSCSPSRQQTNRYKQMGLSPFAKRKSLTVMSSPPGSTSSSLSSRTQVKKNVLQLHASEGVESIRLPSLSISKGNNNRYSNYRDSSNTTSCLPPFCSPLSSRKKIVYRKASAAAATNNNSNPPDAYATDQQKREKYIPPWATPNLRKTKRSIKMLPTESCEETIQIPSAPFSSQEGFSPTKGNNNNNKCALENDSPSSKTLASPTPLSPRQAPPPPLSPPTHIMNNSSMTSPTKFGIINNKKTSSLSAKMASKQKSVSLPEGTTVGGNGIKTKASTATDSKRIDKSLSMPETSEEKQVLSPKLVTKNPTTTPLSKSHKKNSKCKKRGSFASSESSLSSSPRSSSFVDSIVAAKTIPKTPKLDDDIDEEAILYRELFGET